MSLHDYAFFTVFTFACLLASYAGLLVVCRPRHVFLFGNKVIAASLVALTSVFALASRPEVVPSFVTGALLVYAVHATVITIAPRSISVDVLRRLAAAPDGLHGYELRDGFVEGFVDGRGAVKTRLVEQLTLGHVKLVKSRRTETWRYVLTPRGRRVLWGMNAAAWLAGEEKTR